MRAREARGEQRLHVATHHRRTPRRIGELPDAVGTPVGVAGQHHAIDAAIRPVHFETTTVTAPHVATKDGPAGRGRADARDVVAEVHAVHIGRQVDRAPHEVDPRFEVTELFGAHAREVAEGRHVAAVEIILAAEQVVARRLAAGHAVAGEGRHAAREGVGHPRLGVEEGPVDVAPRDAGVVRRRVPEPRPPPLHVAEPGGLAPGVRQFHEAARVLLVPRIVVEFGIGLEVATMRALIRVRVHPRVDGQGPPLHGVDAGHTVPGVREVEAVAIGELEVVVVAAGRVAVDGGVHRAPVRQRA